MCPVLKVLVLRGRPRRRKGGGREEEGRRKGGGREEEGRRKGGGREEKEEGGRRRRDKEGKRREGGRGGEGEAGEEGEERRGEDREEGEERRGEDRDRLARIVVQDLDHQVHERLHAWRFPLTNVRRADLPVPALRFRSALAYVCTEFTRV